jgi:3-dehydroquinate dehydratase II
MKIRILVIHGPNLNMLGKREPEIYGSSTLDDVNARLGKEAKELGAEVEFFQSNSEGEIVGRIQAAMDSADGILINPGGYTHTSVAIRDAILSAGLPVVEAHMSNIYKREDFRQKSYVSGVAMGVISGFGAESYSLGLRGLVDYLKGKAGS